MSRMFRKEVTIASTGTMAIRIMPGKVQMKALLVDMATRATDRISRDIQVHEVNDTIKNRKLV
jgi:hypothetical protein